MTQQNQQQRLHEVYDQLATVMRWGTVLGTVFIGVGLVGVLTNHAALGDAASYVGIAILIASPVIGLILTATWFTRVRDRLYTWLTLIVLLLLILTAILGTT